jgi:O-methyltransferase domain
MFTSSQAAGSVARFRRKGLRGSALDLATAVSTTGPRDMSLLEVGGGAGQIQVALLESGTASSAINVELSKSWEDAARVLLNERGLDERVERVVGDFVDQAPALPPCDGVILHRVVCCYPDWRALLAASTSKATRLIGMTFPAHRLWIRAGIRMVNLICRIRGQSFRGYVHPPEQMIQFLRSNGFSVVHDQTRIVWRTVAAVRG